MKTGSQENSQRILDRAGLDLLLAELHQQGYALIGPRVRDQAIIYDEIESTADFPVGLRDEQAPGRYRLKPRGDGALFGYTVGPHTWKKFLFPPVQKLFSVTRNGQSLEFTNNHSKKRKFAFIGVRACELTGMDIQDRVFLRGSFVDSGYKSRRDDAFIIAVNCTEAGATCFCASMNSGPEAKSGFDLALTELIDNKRHEFLVNIGTPRGGELLALVSSATADSSHVKQKSKLLEACGQEMGRSLDTRGLREILSGQYESKQWDKAAERCLACGNCTMVCPTCFCTTMEDVTDIGGSQADRSRKWDSCFNGDFSFIHGGAVRPTIRSRYRQWLTHKLGTWHDQFGTPGCVGCGRCITWCPVGIDITEQATGLRARGGMATAGQKER